MDIELGDSLIEASPGDGKVFGDITADAFRNDPFNRWLFGNYAAIKALFHLQARRVYVPNGYCYRHGDDGACMWMLPGQHANFGLVEYALVSLSSLFLSGPRSVVRAIKTGQAMDRQHPNFPHAYLFSIGVRPAAQGKGLGRKLIQPVLDACDRDGVLAYLENSNPANTGFYRSCGFEETGEPIIPEPDSPPLVPMLRQPRAPA